MYVPANSEARRQADLIVVLEDGNLHPGHGEVGSGSVCQVVDVHVPLVYLALTWHHKDLLDSCMEPCTGEGLLETITGFAINPLDDRLSICSKIDHYGLAERVRTDVKLFRKDWWCLCVQQAGERHYPQHAHAQGARCRSRHSGSSGAALWAQTAVVPWWKLWRGHLRQAG